MGNDPAPIIIALIVLVGLILVMRWVFRPSRNRPILRPVDASESPDLGMLTVVLSGLTRRAALERRAVLGEAGIRSSMSLRRDGTHDVLVFSADAERARLLLGP